MDTARWKRELAQRLLDAGAELLVLYTRAALADQARAGLRTFGPSALARYRLARRDPGPGPVETLAAWAGAHGVPVRRFRDVRDPALEARLRARPPDVLVLAGADIVPAALLEAPRLATVNAHYGLLPRYRGMNVAEWSVYHDDPVGVTVHVVDAGIDTGDVLCAGYVPVEHGDTLQTIRTKQQALARDLLAAAVRDLAAGVAERQPQDPRAGRQYYRMHPALRRVAERKLETGDYRWLGAAPDEPALTRR